MESLQDLFARPRPFTTVYVQAESEVEDAADRLRIRLKDVRRDAEQAGAPPAALATLETVDPADHGEAAALLLVVDGEGGFVREGLSEPISHDLVSVDAVPRLGPWFDAQQRALPHLLVVADRVGADLLAFHSGDEVHHGSVDGQTEHIQRSNPGGWSQRRFQQRAENTWDQNAEGVAKEVAELADAIGAAVVLVAGDEHAVGRLREHLPTHVAERVREIDGSRHQDVDDLADEAVRTVATVFAEQLVETLRDFRQAVANDLGVEGAADTLMALSEGRVRRLLVHDDPDDARPALLGTDHRVAFARPEDAQASNLEFVEARAVDAAIAVAVATGAEIVVVPAAGANAPAERLGAVLRG